MSAPLAPVKVFYSYADADEDLRSELDRHLSQLQRDGLIEIFHKRQIIAGTDWTKALDQHLDMAAVILLLISADFLASDYCYGIEMKRALQRHEANEARVIPVIVRSCNWSSAPFAHLQVLPTNALPVKTWLDKDDAWTDVTRGIQQVLFDLLHDKQLEVLAKPNSDTVGQSRLRSVRFGASFPEVWNVSRRHNAFFTGRDQLLQRLFDGFALESAVRMARVQAITGLGGMGKTQTAAEYAYRYRGNYCAVLWMRAETQADLVADFQTIAGLLKRPQEDLQNRTGLVQTMQEWFMTQTDWLLILDNANDLALVDPFLPKAARGHILLTTRVGATSVRAQPCVLEPLSPEDGAVCILRRAGILTWDGQLCDASPADADAAQVLSRLMDGLPLALEQAGAYIDDTACGVRRYLRLYQQYRVEVQRLHHGPVPDYPEAVASAWRISRNIVEQSHPAAAQLLQLCAFLAAEAIPDELLTQGSSALGSVLGPVTANPIALDLAISTLRKYSLLNREADRETDLTRISIHQIMQQILQDEMDESTRKLWAERAVCMVSQALPVMPWQTLQTHARRCVQLIEQWNMTFPEAKLVQQYVEASGSIENR